MILDPGLVDQAKDQGDEVHDEAVEDGDQVDLVAGSDDRACYVFVAGQVIKHLKQAQERPEDAYHQRGDADFLHPRGSFPGGEEEGDEKEGDNDHSHGTAGNE